MKRDKKDWSSILSDLKSSGKSVAAFARDKGISSASIYQHMNGRKNKTKVSTLIRRRKGSDSRIDITGVDTLSTILNTEVVRNARRVTINNCQFEQ